MVETEGAELTERQRYWLEQIKACEASGMSASAYAAEQGFHVGGMYAGKKSLIRKGPRLRSHWWASLTRFPNGRTAMREARGDLVG